MSYLLILRIHDRVQRPNEAPLHFLGFRPSQRPFERGGFSFSFLISPHAPPSLSAPFSPTEPSFLYSLSHVRMKRLGYALM